MERVNDWYSRLYQLINEKESQRFKFGKNDCTIFAADVVLALTDIDLASEYRGKYKTLKEGQALLNANGYSSNVDFLEKNFEEIPLAFAEAGDLGLIKVRGGFAIVVMTGGFAVGITKKGLTRFPNEKINKVFKIG